jgi:hypothetical protein
VFHLGVSACANGDSRSCANTTVLVYIQNSPKAPAWDPDPVTGSTSNYLRSVEENAPVGTLVGPPVAAWNWNGDANVYSMPLGNEAGVWAINPATGQISVARSNGALNYEQTPVFNVVVQAADAGNASLVSSVTVTIDLIPGNDPPVMPSPQDMEATEGGA